MKTIAPALLTALSAETRTIVRCARITRRDGEVFGLTEFDRDLVFDGVTYRSIYGLSPTAISSDLNFQSNNVQFTGLTSDDGITLTDLRLGLFDYARINLFLINYLDLPASLTQNPPKHLILPVRVIGKVSYSEGDYTAEVMGASRFLDTRIPRATSPTCRNEFGVNRGYSKCAVNVDFFGENLTVTDNRDELSFYTNWSGADDRFTGGKVRWTSGPNEDLTVAVIKQSGNIFFLAEPLPESSANGHNFRALPNCQRRFEDCRFFNNAIDFGGEDNLPGLDAYISMEDQG